MYYQTIGVDNQGAKQFVTIRNRDQRIVFGPTGDEQRVMTETAKRNSNDAMRVCLALAAGRELFAQAMLDPTQAPELVIWRTGANGRRLADLDGGWHACVAQPAPDAMWELTLLYNGRPVGRPILGLSPEELQANVLRVYAARAA